MKPHWERILLDPGFQKIISTVKVHGNTIHELQQSGYQSILKSSWLSPIAATKDSAQIIELMLYPIFQHSGQLIYKIAREFGSMLLNTKLDISSKYLPYTNEKLICIEFPDNIRFPCHEGYYTCAFVSVFNITDPSHPEVIKLGKPFKHLDIYSPVYANGSFTTMHDRMGFHFLTDEAKLDKTIEQSAQSPYHDKRFNFNYDYIKYVVNCLLYIDSGEPDLRAYRAPSPPKREGKEKRQFLKAHQDDSLVDMTLVGFNFKKPINYSVNETGVSGHWRWQPYGTRRERVKHIWIDPHIRHYQSK